MKAVKIRKSRPRIDKRAFPKYREGMSSREYIEAYFNANASVYGVNTGAEVYRSLFKPVEVTL